MPATTSAGRIRRNVAWSVATDEWLQSRIDGVRGMGVIIDNLVAEKRLHGPLEDRIERLETCISALTANK